MRSDSCDRNKTTNEALIEGSSQRDREKGGGEVLMFHTDTSAVDGRIRIYNAHLTGLRVRSNQQRGT